MTAILYQTINLVNGKIYVGVDGKCDPGYIGSGKLIKRAIAKYGRENFVRKDLAAFDTFQEALQAEREIVTSEWCALPDNYNLAIGGKGGNMGEAVNRRISKAMKGKPRPAHIVEAMRQRATGVKASPETRARMSRAHRGNKSAQKPIFVAGVWFESGTTAARILGVSRTTIYNWRRRGK